jgi:hypothetical protein
MLQKQAIKQLQSLQSILLQIEESDYNQLLPTLKNASIGKHVRHITEFYQCLLFTATNNTVNYDDRQRNFLLEENVKYAHDYITEIIDALESIEGNTRLLLTCVYENNSVTMETSLYRELTYNIEHTVHHLAIISIAIPMHFNYISLTKNFGYADSTIQYLSKQTA